MSSKKINKKKPKISNDSEQEEFNKSKLNKKISRKSGSDKKV